MSNGANNNIRRPGFLAALGKTSPVPAQFAGSRSLAAETARPSEPAAESAARPPSASLVLQSTNAQLETQVRLLQRERDAMAERLAHSVDQLRSQGERLAEQARADVIELAFQIARRILDAELQSGPEALFALVRSALRRLGDARHAVIRLAPADAEVIEAHGAKLWSGLAVAQVELRADPTLQRGDCVIETDFGQVDGRLATRIDEVRESVARAVQGDAA